MKCITPPSLHRTILLILAILLAMPAWSFAQSGPPAVSTPTNSQIAPNMRKTLELQAVEKLNAWTVGLAGGQLEGAPIRFATEIARVVDDGDNLNVLPIVTRGPVENVEDLLYLKGVDAAIINSDALIQFKSVVPDVQQRIVYILNLFPSEVHIFVRPEIKTLADLNGKKVNFNTPGTSAAYSGPLIFDQLKLNVQKTFIPHQVALEQMRAGQDGMEAVVFVTTKPVDAFVRSKWDPGFKFLPIALDDYSVYLPSTLTSSDYPQLIASGTEVRTIAVPTILVAYNWPKSSDRFKRVARLTDYLFDRLDKLREPGFHPAWKDVNIGASVPGLARFSAAQDWIDQHRLSQISAASQGAALPLAPDQQQLFQEFLQWRRQNGK
jgi:TRAP-type uncharacterized transport system substrate-binding protein